MEKKAIEFLAEYRVSKLEFDALNELVRVAIATSAYAYSESNVFARIYIFSDHDYEGEKAIEAMIQIQRFTLLRTWSAKLLEYHNFLRELRKLAIDDCEPLLKFLDGNLPKFNELKKMAGYETIRSLRNKVINHLDPSFILANLDHIDEHADLSLHIHEKEGNSFSPVGEHVVFFPSFSQGGHQKDQSEKVLFKDWLDWNLAANRLLRDTYTELWVQFVVNTMPDKFASKRDYWLPTDMVADLKKFKMPLFAR